MLYIRCYEFVAKLQLYLLTTFSNRWRQPFNQTCVSEPSSFFFLCFFPSSIDIYVQPWDLAVAPEVSKRTVSRRRLWFLRARVLIQFFPLHLLTRLWFTAAGCLRFEPNFSSRDHLFSTLLKKSMVGQIRTHALRVSASTEKSWRANPQDHGALD